VKQVSDRIWLVSFMDYDLGYFDDETCRLEPIENPFGAKVLPMCPQCHSASDDSQISRFVHSLNHLKIQS
jgi:hypothetical protein